LGSIAGAQGTESAASPETLERGEELYTLCAYCHGEAGLGEPPRDMGNNPIRDEQLRAPGIAGLAEWYVAKQLESFRSGVRGRHPDDFGGMRMRPMAMTLQSDEDVRALAAYVAKLPAAKPAQTVKLGNAEDGAGLYAVCGGCHGADGKGIENLGPSLLHQGDWYIVEQLKKFQAGVRGNPDTSSPEAIAMQGMAAAILADDQAILDVTAYIGTLGASAE
jgi:cytochrome c553